MYPNAKALPRNPPSSPDHPVVTGVAIGLERGDHINVTLVDKDLVEFGKTPAHIAKMHIEDLALAGETTHRLDRFLRPHFGHRTLTKL